MLYISFSFELRLFQISNNVQTREECSLILFMVMVHFIWSPVAITSGRESGRKLMNVTKCNINKTYKHYLVCEDFCVSHSYRFSPAKVVAMILRYFTTSINCDFFVLINSPIVAEMTYCKFNKYRERFVL